MWFDIFHSIDLSLDQYNRGEQFNIVCLCCFSVCVFLEELPVGGVSWFVLLVCSCSGYASFCICVLVSVSVGVCLGFLLLFHLVIWLVYWLVVLCVVAALHG